jgi:uncharacterized SAM-binding protein YcdF (DUF218 family)
VNRQAPRRLAPWLSAIGGAVLLAAIVWLGGLLLFAATLPRHTPEPPPDADGIVVLTGGAARIEAGLALLRHGKAQRMFISGVHPGSGKTAMRATLPGNSVEFDCCIDLGFAAADTYGNALETAAWARGRGYRRLLVVTANYHMPRALTELEYRLPNVELIPYPVIPTQFKLKRWWNWPGTATLLVEEFDKFLLASLRAQLDRLSGGRLERWLARNEPVT